MEMQYFKNYSNSQDCYVGQNENKEFDFFKIVCISKEFFGVFANDESSSYKDGRLDGFYRLMNVDKRIFEKLREIAIDSQNNSHNKLFRKRGITLLKKIHERNPDKNPNSAGVSGNVFEFDYEKLYENYVKAEPILE